MTERILDSGTGTGIGGETPIEREWTFCVYMAGDNNLESFGRSDLFEMKAVGSTPQVALVAQFDRMQEGNSRRYYLRRGTLLEEDELDWDAHETNTGDPRELARFLCWVMRTYPAKHYALILWNHGSGWKEDDIYRLIESSGLYRQRQERTISPLISRLTNRDQRPPLFASSIDAVLARGIAYDDTSYDFLDNRELQQALTCSLLASDVEKLDLVGFDACLMSMIEVAYQLRGQARYMVSSQEIEPGEGWPYQAVLERLVAVPTMGGDELGAVIVRSYIGSYDYREELTQSVLNLDQIREVVLALNDMCEYILDNQDRCELAIGRAARKAQHFSDPDYKDLYDFCRLLYERTDQVPLQRHTQAIMDLLAQPGSGRFVVAEDHRGYRLARAHGVSIYLPGNEVSPFYGRLDFAAESLWDEVLNRLYMVT